METNAKALRALPQLEGYRPSLEKLDASRDTVIEDQNDPVIRTRLLTVEQVADLLHVPCSWVYGRARAQDSNRLPGMRLGKYWRFNEADILAWLETRNPSSVRSRA